MFFNSSNDSNNTGLARQRWHMQGFRLHTLKSRQQLMVHVLRVSAQQLKPEGGSYLVRDKD